MKLTKKLIKDFLKTQKMMVVATNGKHPWIAPVYYSFDSDLNLYFLSSPSTIHCQQIAKNNKVSVAIYDSSQAPSAKKKGLQLWGIAAPVRGAAKVNHAFRLWQSALSIKNPKLTYANMKKGVVGTMYKITPRKIKFFNEEYWAEEHTQSIDLTRG